MAFQDLFLELHNSINSGLAPETNTRGKIFGLIDLERGTNEIKTVSIKLHNGIFAMIFDVFRISWA